MPSDSTIPSERTCKVCGVVLVRRANEPQKHFAKRLHCGMECHRQTMRSRRQKRQPKTCAWCGKQYGPIEHLNTVDWNKRKTCSHECSHAMIGHANSTANPEKAHGDWRSLTKICEVCGVEFDGRESLRGRSRFLQQKTCSRECAAIARRKFTDVRKTCRTCGNEFGREDGENSAVFRRRQTCGKSCRYRRIAKARRDGTAVFVNTYPAGWSHGYRQRIRDRDGNVCALCGNTGGRRKLCVHHINYNRSDIAPANLITLCISCHGKTNFDQSMWQAFFEQMMAERQDIAA